jgi:hypothetical protein
MLILSFLVGDKAQWVNHRTVVHLSLPRMQASREVALKWQRISAGEQIIKPILNSGVLFSSQQRFQLKLLLRRVNAKLVIFDIGDCCFVGTGGLSRMV